MNADFTYADRLVNAPPRTKKLNPLSKSQIPKVKVQQSPSRNDPPILRKRGPMLDPLSPPKLDFLNKTGSGKALKPVESKFLEPLLNSKKGKWKDEEPKPKRDFSFIRNDPSSPTMNVALLLPHERMYYQRSVNKIQKAQRTPLTYEVQDIADKRIEHGHVIRNVRKPSQVDMNAYKNGAVPALSPLRIVQHDKVGGGGRIVSDNTSSGFGRSSYGGFYSRV